jgi:hypothetical protein
MVIRLFKLIWKQLKNQVRESFHRMSNPNNFFSQSDGVGSSGSSGGTTPNKAVEEEKLWEEYIKQQEKLIQPVLFPPSWGRDFIYGWGVLNDIKALVLVESSSEKDKSDSKDFRWDYVWMRFLNVHKPYTLEEADGIVVDLNLSTVISMIPDIKEFIILIGEEICKGIAFINHWKFLREELYSLLNLVVESNPISAYVTHACELPSLNNECPKLSISEESIEVAIPSGHVENLCMRKQDGLSIAAIPINFE